MYYRGGSHQPSFTRPTKNCMYVNILNLLNELKDVGDVSLTKRAIYDMIGYENYDSNSSNCVWAGMVANHLIEYHRHGRSVVYSITKKGTHFLYQNNL
jgi:predicted transcriptional regulator